MRLDIGFQLVAVLVVVHIARDDEGQPFAAIAGRRQFGRGDLQLLKQTAIACQIASIAEPTDKLGRLLRTDAVDVGKHILRLSGLREKVGTLLGRFAHQVAERISREQALADIQSAEGDIQSIQQSVGLHVATLFDRAHDVRSRLLAKALHARQVEDVLAQLIDIGILAEPA